MKNNKLIILLLFVLNTVFSQDKIDSTLVKAHTNKWSIEIGTGISNGSRPYTDGYFTNSNNQLFNDFKLNTYTIGTKYNFSKIIGLKMDLAFDRFTNNKADRTNPFEVAQFRTSIQGVLNLNSIVNSKKDFSRFNLLFHTGLHLAILQPIATDYNPKVSNGDNYGGIVVGITPMIRISKKTTMFLDFSSFSNYGQNLTWNGKHSAVSNNSNGHMVCGIFGLSFALDKSK